MHNTPNPERVKKWLIEGNVVRIVLRHDHEVGTYATDFKYIDVDLWRDRECHAKSYPENWPKPVNFSSDISYLLSATCVPVVDVILNPEEPLL